MDMPKHNDVSAANATATNAANATATNAANATATNAANATATNAANNITPSDENILCCKNLSEDNEGKPQPVQGKTIKLISIDDPVNDGSSIERKITTKNLAEDIKSKIDYLYSGNGEDLDSSLQEDYVSLQSNEDDGDRSNFKDDGNSDDVNDIKETIEKALS
jgi:hypothetical protein